MRNRNLWDTGKSHRVEGPNREPGTREEPEEAGKEATLVRWEERAASAKVKAGLNEHRLYEYHEGVRGLGRTLSLIDG